MTILRERKTWERIRPMRETTPAYELTPEQENNVRIALRFARVRYGAWERLAKALGMKHFTLWQASQRRRRRPTAGLALRVARLVGVPWRTCSAGRGQGMVRARRAGDRRWNSAVLARYCDPHPVC